MSKRGTSDRSLARLETAKCYAMAYLLGSRNLLDRLVQRHRATKHLENGKEANMTTKVLPDKSPNETLADLVVAKLKEKGLVADGKADEITSKLKAGAASREDWTLWIDLAQTKKQKDGNHGEN